MAKKQDKKWIQGAIKRPGAFTAKAKRRKMTVASSHQRLKKIPLSTTLQQDGKQTLR